MTEATAITAALGSEHTPGYYLDPRLVAFTVSFVALKSRKLSECLSAPPIGLFCARFSTEWIWKGDTLTAMSQEGKNHGDQGPRRGPGTRLR